MEPLRAFYLIAALVAALVAALDASSLTAHASVCPPVSSASPAVALPPIGTDAYYGKYLDAGGIAILGSTWACDRSLQVAHEIVQKMLSQRPDVRQRLVERGAKVAIFAVGEHMTDLPEERDLAGVWVDAGHTRRYDDICGSGAVPNRPTAICENNLIGVEDPYRGRMSVLIHEFGHTIQDLGLEAAAAQAISSAYAGAQAARLFPAPDGSSVSYMMSNGLEYFAEGTANWFNAADPSNPANSPDEKGREFVRRYDPGLFQALSELYPSDNWIYPKH